MKLVRIADYSLILASLLYSSYVSCLFFNSILPPYFAIPLALFIVLLGHHYSFFSIQYFKDSGKLSQASIIAVALMSTVFYSEWKGQHVQAEKATAIPTTEKIDQHIDEVMSTIHQNANKRNWRNVEQYRTASEQLKMLQKEKEQLVQEIKIKKEEAHQLAAEFRIFSVVLFLIAFVASTLNSDSTVETEISSGTEQVLTSTEHYHHSSTPSVTVTRTAPDVRANIVPTGTEQSTISPVISNTEPKDSGTDTADIDRIIALVKSGELQDRREVMHRLKMNVIQANQLFKKYAPKPEQTTIGFVTSNNV